MAYAKMNDLTPLYHGLIAAAFWLLGWLCGEPLAGAAMGAGVFIGREHAQAEYRWIKKFAVGRRRVEMPWWGGFDYRVWKVADLLDMAAPMIPLLVAIWRG